MRAILAGGGTGGHVIPALAIAQELQKLYQAEVLFIGTARGLENKLVPPAGFPLRLVEVGALNRVSLGTRVKTYFGLPSAIWQARRILAEFNPDIVIGVGGYASGPAMMGAIMKGIPTLAFEPNVVPGFANRVVARWVSAAAVHFEETAKFFRHAEITGVPVRQAFIQTITKTPGTQPTLLLCGSGASTVAEIAAAGKPAIFVPFPRAADDHQRVNAQALERAGAAVALEETKLDEVWLVETVSTLLGDSQRLARMSEAARSLAHPNAAHDIAEMAARLAGIED